MTVAQLPILVGCDHHVEELPTVSLSVEVPPGHDAAFLAAVRSFGSEAAFRTQIDPIFGDRPHLISLFLYRKDLSIIGSNVGTITKFQVGLYRSQGRAGASRAEIDRAAAAFADKVRRAPVTITSISPLR